MCVNEAFDLCRSLVSVPITFPSGDTSGVCASDSTARSSVLFEVDTFAGCSVALQYSDFSDCTQLQAKLLVWRWCSMHLYLLLPRLCSFICPSCVRHLPVTFICPSLLKSLGFTKAKRAVHARGSVGCV